MYCEVDRLLTCPLAYKTMANAVNPFGDGRAAQRTVEAIEHMFGLGSRPVPFGSGTVTGDGPTPNWMTPWRAEGKAEELRVAVGVNRAKR